MSRARTLADQFNSDGNLALTPVASVNAGQIGGRRNIVLNGDMRVAQRGTSKTTQGYLLDRWTTSFAGVSVTITQDTDVPSGYGFSNSLKYVNTSASTANGAYFLPQQVIEAQNIRNSGWNYTSSTSYITISFWAKSSNAGTYYASLRTNDGTAYAYATTYTLTANTWKKVEFTVPGNSNLSFDNDNGNGLTLFVCAELGTDYTDSGVATTDSWYAYAGTAQTPDTITSWMAVLNATFFFTGVQLEVGSAATDFEHRSFGEELSLCQRYYTKSWSQGSAVTTNPGVITAACVGNINRAFGGVFWPTTMRAAPTVTWYAGSDGTVNKWRNGSQGTDITPPSPVSAIGESGYGFVLSSGIVGVTDTLLGHYQAEAEL